MKSTNKHISLLLLLCLILSCFPTFTVIAEDDTWESAFYNDVDGDGVAELLPYKYYGVTEVRNDYLNNEKIIDTALTEHIKREETLLYWLHIPYDYNPNRSYPVLVYADDEPALDDVVYTKYLNPDGSYRSDSFDLPGDISGFMADWYDLVKEPGDNREKYDCFFIYIVNPREIFYSKSNCVSGLSNVAIVNQYTDRGADTVELSPDVGDPSYMSTYTHTYDASRLSVASQEQLTVQLIDELIQQYSIDADRQYVMGFSLGGVYAMDIISHYPDRFACAVPICPASADVSEENCKALSRTNIWAISGNNDTLCSKYFSRYFVESINAAKEKFAIGADTVAQYSFFTGGHTGDYVGGTSNTAVSGVSITYDAPVIDFIFNSKLGKYSEVCTVDGDAFGSFETAAAFAGSNSNKTITLSSNVESVDFRECSLIIDLNGYYLSGKSLNSKNISIISSNKQNAKTLCAEGVYHNDVSRFVANGYAVKDSNPQVIINDYHVSNNEVYAVAETGVYKIVADVSSATDRLTDNSAVDLYSDDYVDVTIKVVGAKFAAADVTFTYDASVFTLIEYPETVWEREGDELHFCYAEKGGEYYDDGYSLGVFRFKANEITENSDNILFSVSTRSNYISLTSDVGWNTSPDNMIEQNNLTDAYVNIILKNMTAYANKASNLVYTATAQKLMLDGYYAKDNITEVAITDAEIQYTYISKKESIGTEFDAPGLIYSDINPAVTNAGEYIVFYKIAKPGYATVYGNVSVVIDKARRTLTWTADDFDLGKDASLKDKAGNPVAEDFYKQFSNEAAKLPIAEYDSLETNSRQRAEVVVAHPTDGVLKNVGSYTVIATISDNYEIVNPTCTLLIDGAIIEGYSLQNTDEGPEIWFDGSYHLAAQLVATDSALPGVRVQYSLGGSNWVDSIPLVQEAGKYSVTLKVSAESYYDFVDTVSFEIKSAQYLVEKTDYITGWNLVLVYTDSDVPGFVYKRTQMYDVSSLNYTYDDIYGSTVENNIGNGRKYKYVYGIVVRGDASTTSVTPSNNPAKKLDLDNTTNRYDVNNSGDVNINDLVAIQGVYNSNTYYLTDDQMSIVLKADVSGNKKVDTYDCSLIKMYKE